MRNETTAAGKVVVITGASSGPVARNSGASILNP